MNRARAVAAEETLGQDLDIGSLDTGIVGDTRKLRAGGRPAQPAKANPEAQGQRLKEARVRRGLRTASDAARWLQLAGPTYLAHENGTRTIRPDMAAYYAERFGVSANWILYGDEDGSTAAPVAEPRAADSASLEAAMKERRRLLDAFGVAPSPDGQLVVITDPSHPRPLPLMPGRPHFVPELVLDRGQNSHLRRVELGSGQEALVLRDLVPIPGNFPGEGRFFAHTPDPRDPVIPPGRSLRLLVLDADGGAFIDVARVLALVRREDRLVLDFVHRVGERCVGRHGETIAPEALMGTAVLVIEACDRGFVADFARQS